MVEEPSSLALSSKALNGLSVAIVIALTLAIALSNSIPVFNGSATVPALATLPAIFCLKFSLLSTVCGILTFREFIFV